MLRNSRGIPLVGALAPNDKESWDIPFVCILLLFSLLLVSCDASSILSGKNWQARGLQHQQLRALEVSQKNSSTLYAADVQGRIFVSTTSGQIWKEQSSGLDVPSSIYDLSFDSQGQKLYAATDKGLFTKTEAATTWNKLTITGLSSATFTTLAFLSDVPNVIYVGTLAQGIFVSKDGGRSWVASNTGLPLGVAIKSLSFDPVQNQLWAATSVGAYRSTDRGALWQAFNTGVPAVDNINTVLPASASGGAQGLLYMGTRHGIYLSHDSGAHWATNTEALAGVNISSILIDFHSANGALVYVTTSIGVFQSTDAGQTWTSVATGLPRGTAFYALVFGAPGNAQLYAAGNGIYEFPGTASGVDPTRIIAYLLIAVFFFLLYHLATRGLKRQKKQLKAERIQKTPTTLPTDRSTPNA